MTDPSCFNCEAGVLQLGTHGRYCFDCDTYLPTGDAAALATRYFEAVDDGDQVRAGEIKILLEECRRATIAAARGDQ